MASEIGVMSPAIARPTVTWLSARLLERDLLPDRLIRAGIRRIIASRLLEQEAPNLVVARQRLDRFVAERSEGPIAIEPTAANAQHYEVPTEFYRLVLGRHLKYSSAYWDAGTQTLDEAEARMLALSADRAHLADGQRVLDLGCGWGSMSLWMARTFPYSRIVGVSNSRSQKAWIDGVARSEGLTNLKIVTADMNVFDAPGTFDRIVSIEMFEHMRNWRLLFSNVARWLAPDGRMFLHIFTHRKYAYPYDIRDASDWMAAYFFTGGIMPSDDLVYRLATNLEVVDHWRVSGVHYQRTAEAWLANLDRHRAEVWPILEDTYGVRDARVWWVRWRVFFMACAELWGWNQGEDWLVSHYGITKGAKGDTKAREGRTKSHGE